MSTTTIHRHIDASPARVYRALIDRDAVAQWMVPDGMRSEIHTFDPREGGKFRISLTYDAPAQAGKTSAHTDTHHGVFVTLVPNERVVQTTAFETTDPALKGEMTLTFVLVEKDGGTDLDARHDGLPPGVPPADNETGWSMALAKLAKLVESPKVRT